MSVAPGMNALVLCYLLYNQFFADSCTTPFTALTANDGSNEARALEGFPLAAGPTFEHDLLWAPAVDLPELSHLLGLVVRRDALDYPHTNHLLSLNVVLFPHGPVHKLLKEAISTRETGANRGTWCLLLAQPRKEMLGIIELSTCHGSDPTFEPT